MLNRVSSRDKGMKMLVPTDFSGSGISAAAFAINLFNEAGTEIILENVFQSPKGNTGTLVSIHDIISNDSKALLEKERRHLKAEYKDVEITIRSEEGDIVNAVKEAIRKNNVNLLVVGISKQIATVSHLPETFIEQPKYWPMLTVPEKPSINRSKELVVIVSEGAHDDNIKDISNYLKRISLNKSKIHHLQFATKDKVEQLKSDLASLLTKHKIGMIVFNTYKGDKLQRALIEHQLDTVLLSLPALLIQFTGE